MADEVTLTIDGVSVTVPQGTLVVEAAKRAQTAEIPVYCYHEKLGPAGLCRVCLVEIVGMPKLQIACWTQVAEGMVVQTLSDKASEGRRAIMELFLLNHPLDCPICDKGGECTLQDFTVAYGQDASRMAEPKEQKPKAVDLGPTIVLDEERCIVCQRCVRFEDVITHEHGLVVKDRGSHDIIATASTQEYHSDFSGNVTELCPVGALTSKTYRFKARPWDNHRTDSSCAQCGVGCALGVDVRHGTITRTMSDQQDPVSDGWLCDRGRYGIGFLSDERRLRTPLYRHNGNLVQVSWDDAIDIWAKALRAVKDPIEIAALGGGRLTNEENYLYQYLFRALGSSNLDWRVGRQRQALVGLDAGTPEQLEQAQAIVVVGVPPSQTAPVLDLRIRKAVARNGAKLVSVGPLGAGSFVPETRCHAVSDVLDLLPNELAHVALIWDGYHPEEGRALTALADHLRQRGAQVWHYIVGDAPNARGAEAMGMHPSFRHGYHEIAKPGLDTRGIFVAASEGRLSALSILGANPAMSTPDAKLVKAGLAKIPFLVVSELFATATTDYAHLILPVMSAFERDGHMTNCTGVLRPIRTAIPAPEGILSDGDMLVALADALGITLPSLAEVADVATLITAAGEHPTLTFGHEKLCGSVPILTHRKGDLRLAIRRAIFTGNGTLAHDTRIATLRNVPNVTMAPSTASGLGVEDGALIDVRADDRLLADITVSFDSALSEGWLAVLDGLAEAPANVFTYGEPIRIENIRNARTLASVGA